MTRPISKSERRAMADALRHMHQVGTRYLRHASGASAYQVRKSLGSILLPGRDGIGTPSAGVVTPRQIHSSLVGGKTSQLAGCNGTDAPVAPASFPGAQQGGNCVDQGAAGSGHAVVMARDVDQRHGAAKGRAVP